MSREEANKALLADVLTVLRSQVEGSGDWYVEIGDVEAEVRIRDGRVVAVGYDDEDEEIVLAEVVLATR